ncbi:MULTISPECIES: Do family serine endopeptidase [Phyllobacteriaceae]|jgi:serine protease Do|uniref:Probable periplasmic serine endoprotease DegP-like n=1 Tax=Mesorhizobium hungaricum TaxID=1566387 RepID=A0A1C2DIZ8_9HYPH|nr:MULTISPECIES: Do family serine endopeptidase [Mesorhizobium]MBN9233125.1 Do family serine endopeptidase [Mesorhizobium sp.]MDQ0332189.1 serine protease Do [Mesorhizobium sp. YL-MeA3-2017]OCX14742.1 serine protease [Mesorhizobium hungaricum]
MTASPISSRTRSRLTAAAASVAIAGAIGFVAVTTGTAPVMAEAVRVQAPQVAGFADLVEKVSPAVVSVQVKAKVQPAADDGQASPFDGPDFFQDNPQLKRFFKEFRGPDGQGGRRFQHRDNPNREPRPVAQGSGFFISEDGYIVTNNHVVDGGSAFTVVMKDGKELDAKLVGTDPRTDLAVLKVDGGGQKFTYVDFADDAKTRVGDWVVAVGNPFGLGGTVTAGIVSARGRDIGAGPYDDFIQIDAPVNRGNSGGPTFDLNGQVVGINTAIFSPSGGSVGIAFDIPASTAKNVVQVLMKGGSIERGWLGVEIQPVTSDIAESLGLKGEKGALVAGSQDNSPAKKAGIVAGDVITQVDGKSVETTKDLARTIGNYQPGKSVDVTVWRGGKEQSIKVDLGTLPKNDKMASAEQQSAPAKDHNSLTDLGLTVTKSEDGKGLVVTEVDPDSDAADRGIQAGDVITAINSQEVTAASDISKAMTDAQKAGRKQVLVQITRNDNNRFITLPVAKG